MCMKNFSAAKHGVKALVMHTIGSKHQLRLPLSSKAGINFGNKEKEPQSDKINQPSSQPSSSQTSLKECSVNEAVARSPCLLECLKIVK